MSAGLFPSITELRTVFVDEIDFLEGNVVDSIVHEETLVQRAVLPDTRSIRGTESVSAGVAARTVGDELYVHPYLQFRENANGVIIAHTAEAKRLRRVDFMDDPARAENVMLGLRSAIHCCAQSSVLDTALSRLRESTCVEADSGQLASFLHDVSEHVPSLSKQVVRMIASRFAIDEDASIYGAVQAISAVARDLDDPPTRWVLEEMCGDVIHALALILRAPEEFSGPSHGTSPGSGEHVSRP